MLSDLSINLKLTKDKIKKTIWKLQIHLYYKTWSDFLKSIVAFFFNAYIVLSLMSGNPLNLDPVSFCHDYYSLW